MHAYQPPPWAKHLQLVPNKRLSLASLPTPIQRWRSTAIPGNTQLWIKRDDLTGHTLSGNKVRKLEFLLADALALGCDTVITAGGVQSNHARATAIAARECGMDSHLLLFCTDTESNPGYEGNLLLDRLVGAQLHLVSPTLIPQHEAVMEELANKLRVQGRKPYCIPIGGSNTLGTWGYLEAVRELATQCREQHLAVDDIVFACGSGGTASGLALGIQLCGLPIKVHAVNVCQDADYFYTHLNQTFLALGHDQPAEDLLDIIDGYVGKGYAVSQAEELELLQKTARETGIILDPVYTGKAFYGLIRELHAGSDRFQGRRILFLHTGGLFGLFDKISQLALLLPD